MSKELEALRELRYRITNFNGKFHNYNELMGTIETALKEKEDNDFELQVFKLAYEWKCNGVKGTYEEVLDQARRTVQGWKEIEKKGYGTTIE